MTTNIYLVKFDNGERYEEHDQTSYIGIGISEQDALEYVTKTFQVNRGYWSLYQIELTFTNVIIPSNIDFVI